MKNDRAFVLLIVAAARFCSCCTFISAWFKSLLVQRMLIDFVSMSLINEAFSWDKVVVALCGEIFSF